MLSKDRILAADIGTNAVKLAEFVPSKGGTVELLNFAIESLGLAPGEDHLRSQVVTTTLQEMMREKGIKPGPAVICVSGQQVFSRFVKLPPVDKDKIAQIVAYEAQQNVPFPIEEVVWDYQLIGSTEDEMDVMLAAIKGDIVQDLTDAATAAGLTPEVVDVAPMAVYNAARFSYPDQSGCTLLVDIGGRSTDLIFLEEGRVFIRSIPVAGNAITQQLMREFDLSFEDADLLKEQIGYVGLGGVYTNTSDERAEQVSKVCRNVMTRMHAEINRSISFYRGQQGGSKPQLLLLTGGTSKLPNTDRFFHDKLKIDVDYFNPFENVPIHDSIDTEEATNSLYQLGQVVGLALRRTLSCPIEINLMPDSIKAQKALRQRRPIFVAAGLAAVLALAVWCGYFYKMAGLAGQKYDKVNQEVTSLKGTKSKLQKIQARYDELESQVDDLVSLDPKRTEWVQILDELRTRVPEGMWLTSVVAEAPLTAEQIAEEAAANPSAEEDEAAPIRVPGIQGVTISGVGWKKQVSTQAPLQFRDQLRESALFSEETELISAPPPSDSEKLRRFSMRLVLEKPL